MQKIRGAYAKGIAKRAAILENALEAFSKSGYLATSMREIAAASDLTQAGLLHHFPNKEALLLAIIQERQARQEALGKSLAHLPLAQRILKQLEVNESNRSETLVFSILAAEAEDENHPAHEYILNRYRETRSMYEKEFCDLRGGGAINDDDRTRAALLLAVWDGLQLQSLLDKDFDLSAPFKQGLELILGKDALTKS
jgi:AcrR family transcriptional regulator